MKLKQIFKAWLKTIVTIAILVCLCRIVNMYDSVNIALCVAICALYRAYYNDKD